MAVFRTGRPSGGATIIRILSFSKHQHTLECTHILFGKTCRNQIDPGKTEKKIFGNELNVETRKKKSCLPVFDDAVVISGNKSVS